MACGIPKLPEWRVECRTIIHDSQIFPIFEISAILYFLNVIQWGQIHENDKVQCQLFQYWIHSNGSMVDQYCFHIWNAYRLWWPNSKYDLLTSVWPSKSKISRDQKVGQSKRFSNHGLWHKKMTGMKSRMQNCNFFLFFEILAILYSPNVIQ